MLIKPNLRVLQAISALDKTGHTISLRNIMHLTDIGAARCIYSLSKTIRLGWITIRDQESPQYLLQPKGRKEIGALLHKHKAKLRRLGNLSSLG